MGNASKKMRGYGLVLVGFCIAGCGESDGTKPQGSGSPNGGQITDMWRPYCVATFTAPYDATDAYERATLHARPGEEYLLTLFYVSSGGEQRVSIAYLTPFGPVRLEVGPDAEGAFPFTTNCTAGATVSYYAVFTDLGIYSTPELTTKLCDLEAGTVVPLDIASVFGVNARGVPTDDPRIFEVRLNAFGARCGGATLGYVSVPSTEALGTSNWLEPIISIVGPE